jgi:hypothetical protein
MKKELIEEFIKKYCADCRAYFVCGAELAGCPDFEKFIKENKNE